MTTTSSATSTAASIEAPAPIIGRWVIVDLDGTIALHVNPPHHQVPGEEPGALRRAHHDYESVDTDLPNPHIIALVDALQAAGHEIMFMSGRPSSCRRSTREWLRREVGEWTAKWPLFMRNTGDRRGDDVVKPELLQRAFDRLQITRQDIMLAIDDRPRVIRKWQSMGIPVIDVAPESGEF